MFLGRSRPGWLVVPMVGCSAVGAKALAGLQWVPTGGHKLSGYYARLRCKRVVETGNAVDGATGCACMTVSLDKGPKKTRKCWDILEVGMEPWGDGWAQADGCLLGSLHLASTRGEES